MNDPATSHWVREALGKALRRDPVDAASDALLVQELLEERADEVLLRAAHALGQH